MREGRAPDNARRPQQTSKAGVDFLIRQEGAVPYAYNDSQNNATFGVGHLIHLGPVNHLDKQRWGTKEHPKTMAHVKVVLMQDLLKYEDAVRRAVRRRMYQHRFDACVSLCFNIGTGDPDDPRSGGFAHSTVAKEIRSKKKGFVQRAGDAFLLWDKPPELIARRRRERRLFLRGDYGV